MRFVLLLLAALCSISAAAADPFPFHCLPNGNSSGNCVKHNGCAWCQGGSLPGICVSNQEADVLIKKIPGVECQHTAEDSDHDYAEDVEEEVKEDAPYDVKCLTAISNTDDDASQQDACDAATDSNGESCVWCSGAGVFSLCLSTEQAAAASEYLQCDALTTSEDQELNPFDTSCTVTAYNAEDAQAACNGAVDDAGAPCIWCAADDTMGVCVNNDQAQKVGQYLQCDASGEVEALPVEEETVQSIYDVSCVIAGYTAGPQGETVCADAKDADGQACVWCSYMNQVGVCMTYEQSDFAEQQQFQCNRSDDAATMDDELDIPYDEENLAVVEFEDELDNPYDVTCALAGFSGADGESACSATQDQVGAPCHWCAPQGAPQGLCLTVDQERILEKLGIDCSSTTAVQNPYDVTCAIAGYTAGDQGESVCKATQDQDGGACEWCTYSGQGLCLTDDQAQIAEQMQFECDTSVEAPIEAVNNPYDVTCALAGFSAGADGESACDVTQDQDGNACAWCAPQGTPQGLCLTQDQEAIAEQIGIECGSRNVEEANPYDVTCAIAGYTAGDQGESVCKATQDQDGGACEWCTYGGQGLCLTDDQAQIAEQMQFECDSVHTSGEQISSAKGTQVSAPYDVTCALAGFSAGADGESVCDATQDQDGNACAWCAEGLCLTQDQEAIAEQIGIDCGGRTVTEANPYDVTCAIAGYTAGDQGESVCKSTQDQDGSACEWCSYGGQGLCLTDDQAQIAEQMQFDCDSVEAPIEPVSNPYDITCAMAGFSAGADGESACDATEDQGGLACAWCDPQGAPQGLCLTQDQEAIADQMGIDCGDRTTEESNPYDVTCAIAGYTAGDQGESVCKSTQDQDGGACEWCTYSGQGVCLTDDQAQIAEQMQFKCDTTVEAPIEAVSNPYDVTCALAGFSAGADGESACEATQDQDGNACGWCDPQGTPQGLCLTQDQEAIAEQIGIDCGSRTVEEVSNPYDVTCAIAAYTAGDQGESVCNSTQDQDGEACEWCTYSGQGVCLTDEQAQIAEQMQFECDSSRVEADDAVQVSNPYDVTCALAGFSAGADGESACSASNDQDGSACGWCAPQGMPQGLCLTQDQQAIAEQMGIDCSGRTANARDPYDITCAVAGYTAGDQGESVCKSTQDQEGAACEWCTYGGQGLCLTDDQAQFAEQMQFECDSSGAIQDDVAEDPIPPVVKDCLKNVQEGACNLAKDSTGTKCSWCNTVAGFGLCFTEQAKEMAEAEFGPLFQCDDANTSSVADE